MSTLKVGAIKGVSASSDAITINNDGTCTANLTNKSGKNLIINGAMLVAQRGTSSTSEGYHTVDRFDTDFNGTNENPTQAQVDVSSGDTPYTLGFTKAWKITNGNQSSVDATDWMRIRQRIEAQNVRNSGWNYKSSSSYITIQFWARSSVAQTFYLSIKSYDGTGQTYSHPFALSANTWTKITHSIPGNTNLDFDNNDDLGLDVQWALYYGTDYTDNSKADDSWGTHDAAAQTKDNTSTWWSTNDATFELTGVKIELGSIATDFEQKTFAEELTLCHRYCNAILQYGTGDTSSNRIYNQDYAGGNGMAVRSIPRMRLEPTITYSIANGAISADYSSNDFIQLYDSGDSNFHIYDVICEAEI